MKVKTHISIFSFFVCAVFSSDLARAQQAPIILESCIDVSESLSGLGVISQSRIENRFVQGLEKLEPQIFNFKEQVIIKRSLRKMNKSSLEDAGIVQVILFPSTKGSRDILKVHVSSFSQDDAEMFSFVFLEILTEEYRKQKEENAQTLAVTLGNRILPEIQKQEISGSQEKTAKASLEEEIIKARHLLLTSDGYRYAPGREARLLWVTTIDVIDDNKDNGLKNDQSKPRK